MRPYHYTDIYIHFLALTTVLEASALCMHGHPGSAPSKSPMRLLMDCVLLRLSLISGHGGLSHTARHTPIATDLPLSPTNLVLEVHAKCALAHPIDTAAFCPHPFAIPRTTRCLMPSASLSAWRACALTIKGGLPAPYLAKMAALPPSVPRPYTRTPITCTCCSRP